MQRARRNLPNSEDEPSRRSMSVTLPLIDTPPKYTVLSHIIPLKLDIHLGTRVALCKCLVIEFPYGTFQSAPRYNIKLCIIVITAGSYVITLSPLMARPDRYRTFGGWVNRNRVLTSSATRVWEPLCELRLWNLKSWLVEFRLVSTRPVLQKKLPTDVVGRTETTSNSPATPHVCICQDHRIVGPMCVVVTHRVICR